MNDIAFVIGVLFLLFADDIKIFRIIRNPEDCDRLQQTLISVLQWCKENCMKLNVKKSAVVTFHRSKNPIVFDYLLGDDIVTRKNNIRDLGVVFSNDLNPGLHIDTVCTKASNTLGYIIRASRSGLSIGALRLLYVTLVRPILEYCSVVWRPYQIGHKDRLQKIQRRFVRMIGVRLGHDYTEVPMDEVEKSLDLLPLAARRELADALFLRSVLQANIDCPEILALINLKVPASTRIQEPFVRQQTSTSYEYNSVIPRLHNVGNNYAQNFDFFVDGDLLLKKLFITSNH